MNKRHLRPWVEYSLAIIFMIMGLFFAFIDAIEINIKTTLFITAWMTIMYGIYKVVKEYGTGVIFDEE